MDILLAAAVALAAVLGWTAFESTMARRLRRDTRPLRARNAAVAGAHRLSVVGHLGLVAVAVALAAIVPVPLWWSPVAVASPLVGGLTAGLLLLAAAATVAWVARRDHKPRERRALLAVVAAALSTEVLLRGLALGLLDLAGWPVTMAVLLAAVATGLLQAWRAVPGSRAFGFVLATVLGFALGLVVVLTGSVLAAVAIHVVVAVVGLARTVPTAAHGAGCACGGHDHDAPTGATSEAPASPDVAPAVTGRAHSAACGSTCDHAGTSACASCPLSTARV
ncbi:type II CAAX prenyl endopeptidase Rce1 family protein [Jannaschia sp. R86511]|uniref:CPBP family glutamic-type intramembrane protease n=1 Tax=Jannaschia sp. R86511 TaxID=3093853 RepID=UPI0036D38BCA